MSIKPFNSQLSFPCLTQILRVYWGDSLSIGGSDRLAKYFNLSVMDGVCVHSYENGRGRNPSLASLETASSIVTHIEF